jgi:hypothetical protein
MTHEAAFQRVDIRKARADMPTGVELNFRDYYGFNIAAHHLACLINRCDLVPPAVERDWRGERGAMVWWVENVMMDEQERNQKQLQPPSGWMWARQQYLMRTFTQLTGDIDRNMTNQLILDDWRLVLIDFSRAFRMYDEPKNLPAIQGVEADVLDGLRGLTKEKIQAVAGRWLSPGEINAVLKRRDGLVAHFDGLIAQRGRAQVVYPVVPPAVSAAPPQ